MRNTLKDKLCIMLFPTNAPDDLVNKGGVFQNKEMGVEDSGIGSSGRFRKTFLKSQ